MTDEYTLIGFRRVGDDYEIVDAGGKKHGPVPASMVLTVLEEIAADPTAPPVQLGEARPALAGVAESAARAVEKYVEKKSPVAHTMLRIMTEKWPVIQQASEEGRGLDMALVSTLLKGGS